MIETMKMKQLSWFMAIFIVILAGMAAFAYPAVVQPVQCNHNVHVEKNGMACVDCHKNVKTGARASIPNIEVCGECHSASISEAAEEKKSWLSLTRASGSPGFRFIRFRDMPASLISVTSGSRSSTARFAMGTWPR
ncbi:MAG: cytochrome c3 family protein [Candidatus Aenigmarchaeota archaeon]|nr:cytochrome c3 family protein [Candidatus Aenigmarchaeota archaeon]